MYVGYAFTVAALVAVSIVLYFFGGNPPDWVYFACVMGLIVLMVPFNYRYSRVLYLHWFGGIRYRG